MNDHVSGFQDMPSLDRFMYLWKEGTPRKVHHIHHIPHMQD